MDVVVVKKILVDKLNFTNENIEKLSIFHNELINYNKEYNLTKHRLNDAIKSRLIVTHGPLGCIYQNKNYSVPKVEIKDTSGAGDTFLSGLASMYCYTGDIDRSIIFANECATTVVQKKGVSIV